MSELPDIHAFPAVRLGDFLRAMADPEGTGQIDAERERDIAVIEQRVADVTEGRPDRSEDERPDGG